MLNTLIGSIEGAFLTLVANAALLYAAMSFVRLFFAGESRVVRCVAFGLSAGWLMAIVSMGLLFAGAFTPTGLIGASVLLAALGKGIYRQCRVSPPMNAPELLHRDSVWNYSTAAICIVGFAVLFQFCRGMLMPPLAWDSLTYHMPLAGLWVQNGSYVDLPGPDACEYYSHFPHNGELIFSWLMLPFRSDLPANLGNFPFLLLGGAAVYGVGEELNIGDKHSRILAASLVVLSPPLFAYVTTQYVDVQIFAETMAGTLFLLRFFRTGNARDAALAFAGFGLAAATKVIAIQMFVICLSLFLAALMFRRGTWRRRLGTLCLVLAISGSAAFPWYLKNWLQTGSPLYPFAFVAFGKTILHGSAALQQTMDGKASLLNLTTKSEIAYWIDLCTFKSFPVLNWGPAFVLAALGGLAGIGTGALGKGTRRWQWLVLAVIALTELLQFTSDGMRVARLGWAAGCARYLSIPVALLIMATLQAATKAKYLHRVITACMLGLLFMAFQSMNSYEGASATCKWVHYVTMFAVCSFIIGLDILWRDSSLPKRRLVMCGSFVGVVLLLPFLQQFRDNTRMEQFERVKGLHSLFQMQDLTTGWRYLDGIKRPLTIAVTAGWGQGGHNWFLYPLMGRRLQNRVTYVSTAKGSNLPSYAPNTAAPSGSISVPEWLGRLTDEKVDFLFVIMPPPPELDWITQNPSCFEAVDVGKRYRIYRYHEPPPKDLNSNTTQAKTRFNESS